MNPRVGALGLFNLRFGCGFVRLVIILMVFLVGSMLGLSVTETLEVSELVFVVIVLSRGLWEPSPLHLDCCGLMVIETLRVRLVWHGSV